MVLTRSDTQLRRFHAQAIANQVQGPVSDGVRSAVGS